MNTVKIKRSSVAGKVPTTEQLVAGEIGMNTTDEKMYFSSGANIVELANRDAIIEKYNFQYGASELDTPNDSNWSVNVSASNIQDPDNTSLPVRAFDDTLEEGVGFLIHVPASVSDFKITLTYKAATAPGTAKDVILKLYTKAINIGSAIGSWSSATVLDTVVISTDTNYHMFTQTITLATLGLTANQIYQFELTRDGGNVNDTLVGDFHLLNTVVKFS